jgi:hypothetical protein
VGVKQLARFGAIFGIDMADALGSAGGAEALTVRGRRGAVTPVFGEWMAELK